MPGLDLFGVQAAEAASGHEVSSFKLATWNLDWLTRLPASSPLLPDDIPRRTPRDWSALAAYATRLNADIVAVQEVTDATALGALFPPAQYQLVMSHAPIAQNIGLALRAPWHAISASDVQAFDRAPFHEGHALRPALDVTISNGVLRLRLLVVHLKSGCWARLWTEKNHSCPILREQIELISNWIAEREDEGEAYAVLGDFNRRLTLYDPYYQQMVDGTQPRLVTAGLSSPCEGGSYFIDHIILGGPARDWLVPDSLRVMIYDRTDPSLILSDHCAVSVRLLPHAP